MVVDYNKIVLNGIKPLEHQLKVCKFMHNPFYRSLFLFHSVGSGKTISALVAAKCILDKYPNKKVIVLTPSSLVSNFEKEIEKLKLPFRSHIIVRSYKKFVNLTAKGNSICEDSILIVDESHNLNGGGVIYKSIFECAKKAFKVILLSATPVKNSIGEIAFQFSLLTGHKISKKKLDDLSFINDVGTRRGILQDIFKCKISFYKVQDKRNGRSSKDFPDLVTTDVKLKMSDDYYKSYYKIQEDVRYGIPDFLKDTKSLTAFYNGIRRAVNTLHEVSPKIEWTLKKIKQVTSAGKKVLVYSNWIDTGINLVKRGLDSQGLKYGEVSGNLSKSAKDYHVRKFNSGETKILLVSASGSEGLNLKEVNTVIILEPYWNQSRIDQVIGRAVRFKSHSQLPKEERVVHVYNLILVKPDQKHRETLIQGIKGKKVTDVIPSADVILYEKTKQKQISIDTFYKDLEALSIEKDKDCFPKHLRTPEVPVNDINAKGNSRATKPTKLEQELLKMMGYSF